jgi:hypothetical protein
MPAAEYQHDKDGNCVIGFGVSRSAGNPSLEGVYFAGDWASGRVWGLARDAAGKWQFQELLNTKLFFMGGGEGEDGTIYVTHGLSQYGAWKDPLTNDPCSVYKIVPKDKVPAGAKLAPKD